MQFCIEFCACGADGVRQVKLKHNSMVFAADINVSAAFVTGTTKHSCMQACSNNTDCTHFDWRADGSCTLHEGVHRRFLLHSMVLRPKCLK